MNDLLNKPVIWNNGSKTEQRQREEMGSPRPGPPRIGPIPLPIAIALGAGALVLFMALGSTVTATTTPTATGVPAPTTNPCAPASNWIDVIVQQETAGQWDVAATNARTALTIPNLCQEDRGALAEKAVADGLKALFARKFPAEDPAAQQQAVDLYQGLKRFANENHVPIPSARQVAEDAYKVGEFLLAKVAFEEGLQAHEFALTDQAQVQFYVSTLYDLGSWYAEKGATEATRTEGLQLLSASNRTDRRYSVGSGAAWGELKKLLGPDETNWPPPAETPLLANDSN